MLSLSQEKWLGWLRGMQKAGILVGRVGKEHATVLGRAVPTKGQPLPFPTWEGGPHLFSVSGLALLSPSGASTITSPSSPGFFQGLICYISVWSGPRDCTFGDFWNKPRDSGSLPALIILPTPVLHINFPPRTIHILYICLVRRMPGEITWFCTWDLLEVGGETILFHLIMSYLWVYSFLNINETYCLHLAVTALSTPLWLHFHQVIELRSY